MIVSPTFCLVSFVEIDRRSPLGSEVGGYLRKATPAIGFDKQRLVELYYALRVSSSSRNHPPLSRRMAGAVVSSVTSTSLGLGSRMTT
jgi:hypothetical protein